MKKKESPPVRIKLPKAAPGQEDTLFVAVNGIGYRIRRGEWIEVPAPVAEVLTNAGDEALS